MLPDELTTISMRIREDTTGEKYFIAQSKD